MSLIFLISFPARRIFAQFIHCWDLFLPRRLCSVVLSALLLASGAQSQPATGDSTLSESGPRAGSHPVLPHSVNVRPARIQSGYTVTRAYAGQIISQRRSRLGFPYNGQVAEVRVDLGSAVKKGELLIVLDTEQLRARAQQAAAQVSWSTANVDVAQSRYHLTRDTRARLQKLAPEGHVSAQRLQEASAEEQAAKAQVEVAQAAVAQARAALAAAEVDIKKARIEAPFDGVIQERLVDEGSFVVPGQTVLSIVEVDAPQVHVALPLERALGLTPGVDFRFVWQDEILSGSLQAVLPEVDSDSRTVTAVFNLASGKIRPAHSLIELQLQQRVDETGFWIPLSALSEAQRGLWSVFIVAGDETPTVHRELVEVLHTEADQVFVRGTVSDGDKVVLTGVQHIVPGQAVNVIAALAR